MPHNYLTGLKSDLLKLMSWCWVIFQFPVTLLQINARIIPITSSCNLVNSKLQPIVSWNDQKRFSSIPSELSSLQDHWLMRLPVGILIFDSYFRDMVRVHLCTATQDYIRLIHPSYFEYTSFLVSAIIV